MRLLKKLASGRCSMLTLITVIALASTLASGAGVGEEAKVVVAAAPTIESPQATPSQVAPVAASTEQQVSQASQPQEHHIEPKSAGVAPGSGPGEQAAESAPVAQHAQVADGKTAVVDAKTGERKGRSEGEKSATSVATGAESSKVVADASKASPAEKSAEKKADANKTSEPTKIASNEKGASSGASQGKPTKSGSGSSLSGKSAIKSKLPANLGTVTSTGSGGQALYMSKHDAYSAIAEKHGALAAHSSMMKKADKRQMHSFGGIQKASGGLGDMLSPFKGVTDGGLARTLGASMRSIVKGKYAVPAYVASALLGAVALMAFYESPISPLPVPALPEPPVGRFPPEMPSLPIGSQVPFRGNQQQYGQQNYNQRSFNGMQQQPGMVMQPLQQQQQQQASQILFPSASQQPAQQRQMNVATPVQQLAANLLSGGKQNAQRKSGLDYDPSSSRSFFGGAATGGQHQLNTHKSSDAGSFLSYFGLGGSAGDSVGQMSSMESKGSNGAINSNNLSGSHIINKVRSMLSRSPATSASSSSSSSSISAANANPWDQYQRMSFVQALMKDAAFLPGYLTTSRKSTSASPASATSSPNKAAAAPSSNSASQSAAIAPASRMQGSDLPLGFNSFMQQPQQASGGMQQVASYSKPQKAGSGLGIAKIAHALLDTFTSGIMQRHAGPVLGGQQKSANSEESISPLVSATSLLTDMLTSYNSAQQQAEQQSPSSVSNNEQQAKSPAATSGQQSVAAVATAGSQSKPDQLSARSLEVGVPESGDSQQKQQVASKQADAKQAASAPSASAGQQEQSATHVRKTRSIGLEYPIESNQMLEARPQQPSKAAQINNVIDFVSDSYSQNRMLFNFMMNRVGLSHAVPYVEQILAPSGQQNH